MDDEASSDTPESAPPNPGTRFEGVAYSPGAEDLEDEDPEPSPAYTAAPEGEYCPVCLERGKEPPNRPWKASEEYCYIHDPSDFAEKHRADARQKGGQTIKRQTSALLHFLDPDDVDLTTYRGQREFLSAMAKGILRAGLGLDQANVLRQIAKECRDLTDKIRDEAELEERMKDLKRRLEEERD